MYHHKILVTALGLLIFLASCNQSSKDNPIVEQDTPSLFTSTDLSQATIVNEINYKEVLGTDAGFSEDVVELPFSDTDEAENELNSEAVLAGADGWLVLYRERLSDGLNQIRLYDQADNTNRVNVFSGSDEVESVAVSEDGLTVVASIKEANGNNDVYLFDLSVIPEQVYKLSNTVGHNETNVSITGDGLKIAWQRQQGGFERPFICNYDAISHKCSMASLISSEDQIEPSLSANGEYLVLVKKYRTGRTLVRRYEFATNSYVTVRRKDAPDRLSDPSVDDTGTKVMYIFSRASNDRDYIRIMDFNTQTISTELSSSEVLEHAFITRDAKYSAYEAYVANQDKFLVRTRNMASNSVATPQTGPWEYKTPFWMLSNCMEGTTVTGNQTLRTQAQVDALTGVSKLEGNILIMPINTNLDFTPFKRLKEITGSLTLHRTDTYQTEISGFDCLETIGQNFDIYNEFGHTNALSSLGGFTKLSTVGGNFRISHNNALSNLDYFPALTSVGGNFIIEYNNQIISLPEFPALASVSDFGIYNNNALVSINGFPALAYVESFTIGNNAALKSFANFPALTSAGNFYIARNDALSTMGNFPMLSSVGDFGIYYNPSLTTVPDFSVLTSVHNYLSITNNRSLTNIFNFPVLSSVGSNFRIANNPKLTSFPDFSALGSVGGYFSIISNKALTSMGSFPALTSVRGYFSIYDNDALRSISDFSALKSVGRYFYIHTNESLTSISDFSALDSVGGNFYISAHPKLTNISDFSALESVGSDFLMNHNNVLTNLPDFSALESIGGYLSISNNDVLTSISEFAVLSSVGASFRIADNDSLISISGFNQLNASNIKGISRVFDNPMLNCQNPEPNFSPVDISTGNLVDCP